jgi:hypothetical protein
MFNNQYDYVQHPVLPATPSLLHEDGINIISSGGGREGGRGNRKKEEDKICLTSVCFVVKCLTSENIFRCLGCTKNEQWQKTSGNFRQPPAVVRQSPAIYEREVQT